MFRERHAIVTVIAALLVIGLGAALFLLFMPREGETLATAFTRRHETTFVFKSSVDANLLAELKDR